MNAAWSGPRRVLVLGGKTGLLGMRLAEALRDAGWEAVAQGRDDVDVTDAAALKAYLEATQPHTICNTIAYTQVDKAEDEPDAAMALNRNLPVTLGRFAKCLGMGLVHFSTDFVFDGKAHAPYETDAATNPMSVYGRTKLAGETGLLALGLDDLCIIRTAWLFGPGKKNFVRTILTLAAQRDALGVVHDQVGSPTFTVDLARYSVELMQCGAKGLFHIVNGGRASWCELAAEAVHLAGLHCTVNAIGSADYPQKAVRPAFSALCTRRFTEATGITPRPWAQALRDYVYQEFPPAGDD
ncbi:MAG: dTDP-4-dehydrorhamnose reductase [Desulfovibrionaceae bacterium]